jgi:hypothetical protein
MAANTPSEYCCHYAFIYIRFIHRVLPPAHPQSVSHVGASIYCARTRMAHTYLPIASQSVDPHTCFWPEAIATSQPTRRIAERQPPRHTAERQPCRGANSLRPHPHGPHIFAYCIAERQPAHVFLAGGHRHQSARTSHRRASAL